MQVQFNKNFMEEFKSKEAIPPEDVSGKEKKVNREYKYDITKYNERKAEEARKEIKEIMEKSEELKKKSINFRRCLKKHRKELN